MSSSTKKQADSNTSNDSNGALEQPTQSDVDVTAPVANLVNSEATKEQYEPGKWDGNADNQPQGGGDSSGAEVMIPDGRGSLPRAAKKEAAVVLTKASASQVYQLADLYTELGLVPHESRYAAIAEIEKMPQIVAAHTIKVLARVKEVFAQQLPQGRVARTAGTIPVLGKTAGARTPSMARQAETRRLASSAEDTLLLF